MRPLGKNIAALIIEEDDGHRRPIGFVKLDGQGIVTTEFNIISKAHSDLEPGIRTELILSREQELEHGNEKAEARAGSR